MGALIGRGTPPASLPSLLEFHSPSAALTLAPVRGPARATTWVVCSLALACGAAASLIPVDKVVTAHGRVVARTPTLVVQPLETAIVRAIDVHEGEVVHRGEVLARLDPTFAAADAGALAAQVGGLEAEVARLRAEASGQPYEPRAGDPAGEQQATLFARHEAERGFKRENYRQRIEGLQAQVARSMADVAAYTERLRVATEVESKRAELERLQAGSQLNRLGATDNRIEVARNLDGARGQAAQGARDLEALRAERDGFEQQWRGEVAQQLSDQTRKLADAREQLNKARLRRQLVELRAEQDATVQNIAKVSVGSVLQSGDQFLTLVPLDAPLEAEVDVAGADAGFVRPGDDVTVKFDTFPFTQYGSATGTVRVVSPDSFAADPDGQRPQRGAPPPRPPGGPSFFRGRVSLDRVGLHDVPDGFRVAPGMPVTADIKVGRRTVMSYLLGRVLPVALDGMREP